MSNYCDDCGSAMERMISCPKCHEAFVSQLETLRAQLAQKETVIKNLTATNKYNIEAYLVLASQNRLMVEALSSIENTWSEDYQKNEDGFNEPSRIATKALSAISPETLERYRLEREVVETGLLNCVSEDHFKAVKALEAHKAKA